MIRQTPMLRQYRQIKARELDLVLTSRQFGKGTRLPMCGVPYRTVTSYVGRPIERGHKVALVEQLEGARKAKGLPKRDVVRVFTPGTVVEEALLQKNAQNHGLIRPGYHRALDELRASAEAGRYRRRSD